MRRVGDFSGEKIAASFVRKLNDENITALIEEDEGKYVIWVHEEKDIKSARALYDCYLEKTPELEPKEDQKSQKNQNKEKTGQETPFMNPRMGKKPSIGKGLSFAAPITRFLLFTCVIVFLIGVFQVAKNGYKTKNISGLSPIAKALLIDYPENDKILQEAIDRYGLEKVQDNSLPKDADALIQRHNAIVPWVGVYNYYILSKEGRAAFFQGQFLQDVTRGEVWRLFTPAILHTGLLHILFNMLWLVLLGKMVEFNMGSVKFILFVLLTAIISNLCQYVMSGPYFMGISGVLSGFIGYILVRKKIAPWEAYFIGKETLNFFLLFIFGFLALQIIAFFLQVFNIYSIPLFMANTAHISGLVCGLIAAKINIFAKKIV